MKLLQFPLRCLYLITRQLRLVDVKWLMHMPAGELEHKGRPDGYEIRIVPIGELAELRRCGLVSPQVGDYRELEKVGRILVGAFAGQRLVSFAWFAKQAVAGKDNYGQSMHLGTSIDLPEDSAFIYNTWTDEDHRGNRLMAALFQWAIRNRIAGGWSVATMTDWTNVGSGRAFENLGMRKLGLVVRLGWGPVQMSLLPLSAKQVGLRVAADAPGVKLAL